MVDMLALLLLFCACFGCFRLFSVCVFVAFSLLTDVCHVCLVWMCFVLWGVTSAGFFRRRVVKSIRRCSGRRRRAGRTTS